MTLYGLQINEGWLRDGMRLEAAINYLLFNQESGLLSKWIKKDQILYKKNDTSTIQGYRSRVSRGVDHRIEAYNKDTGKRLIIEIEDKNLNEKQQRSLSFWIQQLNFSPDAEMKIDVCPRGCLTKRTLDHFEEQGIIHIDTEKKLRQDNEMYDKKWNSNIRKQFYALYYSIKSFMEEKKPSIMCSISVDDNKYMYNSIDNNSSIDKYSSSLVDKVYVDRYKIEDIDNNIVESTNQYSYNHYTIGYDTPEGGGHTRITWALALGNDNI